MIDGDDELKKTTMSPIIAAIASRLSIRLSDETKKITTKLDKTKQNQ